MNMNMVPVSIIIPTFNRANLVEKAIKSAINQTFSCEIIVCDHGSTDNTPKLMNKYRSKVKYIRRENDFGPHFCWLDGVLSSTGDYIHIQYDDDWIDNCFIEKTLEHMKQDIGMVFTDATVIDTQSGANNEAFPFQQQGLKTGCHPKIILEKYYRDGGLISPGACLFRKKDVIDALYQGRLPLQITTGYHGVGPDSFMTLITLLRYPMFGYIGEKLASFLAHDNSITTDSYKSDKKRKQLAAAYAEVFTFYKALNFWQNMPNFITKLYKRQHVKKNHVSR